MMDGLESVMPQSAETNGNSATLPVSESSSINHTSDKPENVELADNPLMVDISDALSEREKVKFSVHTKTTLPDYAKNEFSVVRQHEEFIWLHDRFEENEDYAGFIIPPPPPRPDFDASREKLQRLGDGEGSLTTEEFKKMKQELEAEYLAIFKKTVAMHEVFLSRLAQHSVFRRDNNLKVFLEYDNDLSVRTKNKKERMEGLFKTFNKSTDELLLSATQKDVDENFQKEKTFLLEYHTAIKDAANKADKMAKAHKNVADSCIKVSLCVGNLGTIEGPRLEKFCNKLSDHFEKSRKIEGHLSSDEDLKLTDTLRYYQRDSSAAKDLLYRRLRCLADYEQANRNLDRARAKNKHVHAAELAQQNACERFEMISEKAKEELLTFRERRVIHFRKNMVGLAELQLKHAKAQLHLLTTCLQTLSTEHAD